MADHTSSRLWIMRLAYLVICMVILFFNLLPLETTPRNWAGPDMLIAVTFAWALRRPEFVPALSIAAVFLMADLMLQRPPGLFAALMLIASESLKKRGHGLRDQLFPVEWLTITMVLAVALLGERLILALLMVDRTSLTLSLIQFVMTVAAYPVVVVISSIGFGVRKSALGEVNSLGQRL